MQLLARNCLLSQILAGKYLRKPKKNRGAHAPAVLSNTVSLLRREAADECAPVRIDCSRRIRDVLVAHPDGAVLIRHRGGVIAPTSDAVAGPELRVASESVVGQYAGAGNPDCARAVHVNRRVPSAREEVQSHYAECHHASSLIVDRHRREHYILLITTVDCDIALVDHRGRYCSPTQRWGKDEPGCRRAHRSVLRFCRGAQCGPELAVRQDNLLQAVIVRRDQFFVVFKGHPQREWSGILLCLWRNAVRLRIHYSINQGKVW